MGRRGRLRGTRVPPGQGSPCPIDGLQVGVAQVELAAHQDDGRAGTEVLDLWVPHGLHMVQGVGVGDGEAQNHNVGPARRGGSRSVLWHCPPSLPRVARGSASPLPAIGKAPIFVVVTKSVPEPQGHTNIVYHIPGALQHLREQKHHPAPESSSPARAGLSPPRAGYGGVIHNSAAGRMQLHLLGVPTSRP